MSFADVMQNVHAYEVMAADPVWLHDMGPGNLGGLDALEQNLFTGAEIHDSLGPWAAEAGHGEADARLGAARQTVADQAVTFLAACAEEFRTRVDEGVRTHVHGIAETGNVPVMRAHVALMAEQRTLGEQLARHFLLLEGSGLLGHAAPWLAQVRARFDYDLGILHEYDRVTREELTTLGHAV
ncbi:hypothetical protein ACIQPQ_20445 [Streptomyces sp. NPDC091281]|uniref:hypothetical protein n=1 Tax=Streptomyces sp. NPDC091281 TaxID=3365985 RepID=UPI0038230027